GVRCPSSSHQDPERQGFIQCFDPCTLQRLGEVKAMTKDDVEDVVKRYFMKHSSESQASLPFRR
ncbi:unnamed protein product, partial [Discosporangium mesarthrocarpum]